MFVGTEDAQKPKKKRRREKFFMMTEDKHTAALCTFGVYRMNARGESSTP